MNAPDYGFKAKRMREEFDQSFALSPPAVPPEAVDLLAIRLRGDAYAIRAKEISGLLAGKKIIPLPGSPPALLGLMGIRGALVPAWDLASLLGYAGQSRSARWLVLGPGEAPWALAFDGFDGYCRVLLSDIHARTETKPGSGYIRESCAIGGSGCALISLPLILTEVTRISQTSQTRRN